MKPLLKTIGQYAFYAFAVAALIATGLRTYHLISQTTGNLITAIFGLVMFEVGMLIWLAFGLFKAEGIGQRAIGIGASFVDLLLVVAATATDVFMESAARGGSAELATAVLWIIIGATAFNVIAMWFAHVLDPEIQEEMRAQNARDRVTDAKSRIEDETTRLMKDKAKDIAADVAARVAEQQVDTATRDILALYNVSPANPSPITISPNGNGRTAHAATVPNVPRGVTRKNATPPQED